VSFTIDDLPTVDAAGRLGRSRAASSALADAYRIPSNPVTDIIGSLGVARALEIAGRAQRKMFPSAADLSALQAAAAAAPVYSTYSDCGPYNYDGTCNEACFGFAPHQMDPSYCATCAEQAADPANNPSYNWHFVGSRGQVRYIDREPDICAGRDAWKWKVGPCGSCAQSAVFRCHDGWKKYPDSTSWDPTICQGKISCDDQLTPC
jgi:hypothetical protein